MLQALILYNQQSKLLNFTTRDSGLDVDSPKHGKLDPNNAPHVGQSTKYKSVWFFLAFCFAKDISSIVTSFILSRREHLGRRYGRARHSGARREGRPVPPGRGPCRPPAVAGRKGQRAGARQESRQVITGSFITCRSYLVTKISQIVKETFNLL